MTSKNANFSTLILLALKDIRNERGIHQGHLAQHTGKSPSAWAKIENGSSPLNTDALLGACMALQIQPSYLMVLVERMVPTFNAAGWYFQTADLGEEDELMTLVNNYFNTPGYQALKGRPMDRVSIHALGNMFAAPGVIPTIVQYCCNPAAQKWFEDSDQHKISGAIMAPAGLGL
ncbi:helix-turn-helix domain-containing protein [Pseudomonas protegens]|uniref:helix-turn-helix domain-containing protein n=1 Tax=Pseudomonas protegens TaxID=380021 RepID=UPI003FD7E4E2